MKVSFVIPFYNEEKNAGPMIDQVINYSKHQKWTFEIIPVNDRSQDSTAEILNKYAKKYKFIRPVTRKVDSEEHGNTMGKALLAGSKKSKGEIIIWTMGDRSDDTKTYGEIVKKINQGYDMVFGSRYMPGGTWGSLDPTKAFLSSRGTILARMLFGVPIDDITNAFRGFKRELIEKIKLESSGYAISPEFALRAHIKGYRLGQVPTVYHYRIEGMSSFKLWKMSISYLKIFAKLLLLRTSK